MSMALASVYRSGQACDVKVDIYYLKRTVEATMVTGSSYKKHAGLSWDSWKNLQALTVSEQDD